MHRHIKLYPLLGYSLLLVFFVVSCGPVHKSVRPTIDTLGGIQTVSFVVPEEEEFVVFNERAKATAGPAIMFGLIGAAVASAHNQSLDNKSAEACLPHLAGISCTSTFKAALSKALLDSGRFSDFRIADKEPGPDEMATYDAVVSIKILNWGIRLVEQGQQELMSTFVEMEIKMVDTQTKITLWDEHDTVLGQGRNTLATYQTDGELLRQEIEETFESAGVRVANTLVYP